jgi:hypothetical protein
VPLNVMVTDNIAVGTVSVNYAINDGSFTSSSCQNNGGGSYGCTIPGNGLGTAVSYYVTATDTATNIRETPDHTVPNLYTVGAATVPTGEYTSLSLSGGSTLGGNVAVDSNIDLQGIVTTGTFTLSLGCDGTVSGAGPGAYVIGNFQRSFCGAADFTFPVGTAASGPPPPVADGVVAGPATGFSPFTAHVTSSSLGASLTIFVVDANLLGSDSTQSESRYWDVTQSGSITADISFTYLDQDVNGDETQYKVLKREGGLTNIVAGGTVNAATNTASVSGVSSFSQWAAGNKLITTAAPVSVAGRVLTSDGRGIANVVLVVSGDALAGPVKLQTNAFGYYVFDGLPSGHSYVVTATARNFTFSQPTRVISLNDDVSDLNFTADSR